MMPVTVEMLRDDWVDDPQLTPDQRVQMQALPDGVLEAALEDAFTEWEEMWFLVLDSTRGDATRALKRALGFEDES